jgi:hypothetical protein
MQSRYSTTVLIFTLAVFLLGALQPGQAHAANWFDRFGSSVVQHGSSAWESQKQGHFAAGGFSVRMPIDRTPLFNFTPPRFQIGCGGIDAFWGGFSFLDPEFLIQKLKNIMQAAAAYAFKMALAALCPQCSDLLDTLEALANQLNQLAMDDCKAGQALAGAAGHLMNSLGVSAIIGDTSGGGGNSLNTAASHLNTWLDTTASGISSKFQDSATKMLKFKYCPSGSSSCDPKKFSPSGTVWAKAQILAKERGATYELDDKNPSCSLW